MNTWEKHIFYYQLSIMLDSGLTVLNALDNLKKTGDRRIRDVSRTFHYGISKGEHFYSLMDKRFTEFEKNIVKAGELSGKMTEVLKTLSKYFEFVHTTRKKIITKTIYPIVILHCAILLPNLPILIFQGVGQYIISVLPVFAILYSIFFLFKVFKVFSIKSIFLDRCKISLPFLGNLIKTKSTIDFLSAFICLYAAGVNVVESVRVSARTVRNLFFQQQIQQAIVLLEKGVDISSAVFSNPYFKPAVADMIKTGSSVGRLEEATNKAIEFLQQDFETSIERFAQVFPIVVYLIVAIYVGYIVISFYTKLYSNIFSL